MFSINGVEISKNKKPFLVAELSANHDGSIDRAKQTIKAEKSRNKCCENSNLHA